MMDNKAGFNLEEIDAYLEFWAVDCEGEGYSCDEKCPYHSPCRTLSSEDHRRMAREIRRLIDTLTEQGATIASVARFHEQRAGHYAKLCKELDKALNKAQKMIEKQNDLLAMAGMLCPEEEDE